ncbi:MAG: PQQ-dependent sugar dehydrogenase [Propylenella sp.]
MLHRGPRRLTLAATAALLANCASALDEVRETEQASIRVQTIADGLDHPWGIVFLPDGSALVTERSGSLRRVSLDGALSDPVAGVPEVDARDQGGLLDVALDPGFADNRLVYLSFSEPGPDRTNSTAVARGALNADATALEGVEVIFSQQPKLPSTKHFGSRLVFDGEGHLFVTLGERSDERFRVQAQDLNSHLGKIVRINPDGSVPEDNPFVGQEGALPEIWSYGHRNIQAAAINPETGALWEIEHGPRGGDELNIPEPGKNYGWPEVSFGVNYSGSPVGTGQSDGPGFEDPIYQWTPVIAPSGMAFYTGDAFPEWKGDLFVGGLASTALVRLELNGNSVVHEERILDDAGRRIRDVVEGPEGALYLITDEDNGEVLRISAAD